MIPCNADIKHWSGKLNILNILVFATDIPDVKTDVPHNINNRLIGFIVTDTFFPFSSYISPLSF